MKFLSFVTKTNKGSGGSSPRQHLKAEKWPDAIYAVGDIHGCRLELGILEKLIYSHAEQFIGEKWLVFLGDYVDRGPDSAGVLERLLSRPRPGWRSIPIAGNHEIMMLSFLDAPTRDHDWLRFGGMETLASYGIDPHELVVMPRRQRALALASHIPDEHVSLLRELPISLSLPGVAFVHAGMRRGFAMEEQSETDLLWIRDEFFDAMPDPELLVVHGHTPSREPILAPGRIGVDTGAFATGTLTAVCLTPNGPPQFLSTTNAAKIATSR